MTHKLTPISQQQIEKTLNSCRAELNKTVESYPWKNKLSYGNWLLNTAYYANQSTRILSLGAGTMPSHLTSVSNRFIKHAAEEKGHEKLLEKDLNSLKIPVDNLSISPSMKVYFQSLYYWTHSRTSPIGLLGWILSLEALACDRGPWILEQTESSYGKECTNFLRVHSDADPDHLKKALETLRHFDGHELALIEDSLKTYSHIYCQILGDLSRKMGVTLAA